MRALRVALAAVAIVVIVIFELSNRQVVSVGFWPFGLLGDAPLSLVVLAVSAAFFLAGAFLGGRGTAAARRRARRAESRLRTIEAQHPAAPVDSFGRPLPQLAQPNA